MTIPELIAITENKLNNLHANLSSHLINWDLWQYENVKLEISTTQETLEKLRSL